jgi:Protein of unknown function (DUF2934)
MKLTLEDRIRERAYFLALSGGGAGDATHFWLIAEQEVRIPTSRPGIPR